MNSATRWDRLTFPVRALLYWALCRAAYRVGCLEDWLSMKAHRVDPS